MIFFFSRVHATLEPGRDERALLGFLRFVINNNLKMPEKAAKSEAQRKPRS